MARVTGVAFLRSRSHKLKLNRGLLLKMRKFCVGHSHTSAHGCECETLAEFTVYSLDNDYVGTAVLSVSRQLLRVKLTL